MLFRESFEVYAFHVAIFHFTYVNEKNIKTDIYKRWVI